MRSLLAALVIFIAGTCAHAQDIQLLNPDFIGQPATAPVETLYELKEGDIEPYLVTTDVKDGRYYTASVFYPASLGFADARAALNRLYRRHEVLSRLQDSEGAVWHVTDKQLAIQLLRREDHIRMIYLQFQGPEEPAKGAVNPEDAVCK